ncbi:MAG TPA: ATP-binding protein [Steroidobacteraceae bacterium]|nr:ATP-binding protein [Steroidobacteraceae bacterium]
MAFHLFNKPLELIDSSDLVVLKDVAEGWYVEYKREPISASEIGKSLSAFANHFGGWLIFGVDAPDRIPSAFPGLDLKDSRLVFDRLRDAASHHVNPVVTFETKEVICEFENNEATSERKIVIVRVRQGRNPPYVHSSGRIYRRIADSSQPKAEADRAVIDQLVARAGEYQTAFKDKIQEDPEISDGEYQLPLLQVYMTQDPWGERRNGRILSREEFSKIMNCSDDAGYTIALENVFEHPFGFVARHVANNNPFNITYTWNYSFSGSSSVVVPIRIVQQKDYARYKYAAGFIQKLAPEVRQRLMDITLLWAFLTSMLAKQEALAKATGDEGSTFIKLKLINVWRCVPYIDTKSYIDHVAKYGLPVIQRKRVISPVGSDPDSLVEIEMDTELGLDTNNATILKAARALTWLFMAVGLPDDAILSKETVEEYLESIARVINIHKSSDATGL